MGLAGRKPTDRKLLRGYAAQWACLLYFVRDGCPGFLTPKGEAIPKGPKKRKSPVPFIILGTPIRLPASESGRTIPLTATVIPIPPKATVLFRPVKDRKIQREVEGLLKVATNTFDYAYLPSVESDRKIWNRLKSARKVKDVEQVFEELRRWTLRFHQSKSDALKAARENLQQGMVSNWPFLPFLVSRDWPGKILATKRVWTYPRSNRPTSDDKRIEFFAKSLAAITLGKSPATATARWLAGWHWPKDWYARPNLD